MQYMILSLQKFEKLKNTKNSDNRCMAILNNKFIKIYVWKQIIKLLRRKLYKKIIINIINYLVSQETIFSQSKVNMDHDLSRNYNMSMLGRYGKDILALILLIIFDFQSTYTVKNKRSKNPHSLITHKIILQNPCIIHTVVCQPF